MIRRRTFLVGLASLTASVTTASAEKFMGSVSTATIRPRLAYRRIQSLTFSSMPTGDELRSPDFREDPVMFLFMGGEDVIAGPITINPRATFRWCGMQGWPVVDRDRPFRMVVEPAHTHVSLFMEFDIERDPHPMARVRCFTESYKWERGLLVLNEANACDPRDREFLA